MCTLKPAKATTKRICLSCDRPFLSEGPWNRICPRCNKANDATARYGTRGRLVLRRAGAPADEEES